MQIMDFLIQDQGPVSRAFLSRHIKRFSEACHYIQHLPYQRNAVKDDPLVVLRDGCGTCSTKHALLQQLAIEHKQSAFSLWIGMFKMNGTNTPAIRSTLQKHGLAYIPEAHVYLKWGEAYLDFTRKGSHPEQFLPELIHECAIKPAQIGAFKVSYHQQFLKQWLTQQKEVSLPFEAIWAIREQCIKDLAGAS